MSKPTVRSAGSTSFRVRYPETDQMGVVHHSHFFTWFEIGRTELMREAGCAYAEMEREGVWMPVIDASCRYLRPARYDELLTVETVLDEATRVTTRFSYKVIRQSDGTVLATGSTRHAATDGNGQPRRLPAKVLDLLPGAGEGRDA